MPPKHPSIIKHRKKTLFWLQRDKCIKLKEGKKSGNQALPWPQFSGLKNKQTNNENIK